MSYWAPLPKATALERRGGLSDAPERHAAAVALRAELESLGPPQSEPGRWNFVARWKRQNAERRAGLTHNEWNFLNHYEEDRAAELSVTEARILHTLMRYAGDEQVKRLLLRRTRRRQGDEPLAYHAELERSLGTVAILNVINFQNLFSPNHPILKMLALASALIFHLATSWLNRRVSLQRVRHTEERLPGSDVIEQVVDGGTELEIIREYTPVMLRWLVLGAPSTSLQARLALLVNNLDWFVQPPSAWFRWQWLIPIAYISGYALALTALFTGLGGHTNVLHTPWSAALAGALVGFGSVWNSNAAPRQLFAALLLEKLDARIEARLAEEAAAGGESVPPTISSQEDPVGSESARFAQSAVELVQ
jgi:hypothetical protein